MKPSTDIPTQFIIDETGKKTGVILDIETFQKLIDELEDFYLAALAQASMQDSDTISHDEVKERFAQKKSKK